MTLPKIIAFGHKSRTGKDTATKLVISYLRTKYPSLKIERRAFADAVKHMSHTLYKCHGLKPRQYYDENPEARSIIIPALGMDPVQVWVAVGNKVRDIYPDTWADISLLDRPEEVDIIVISDLRYPNEAERIHQVGGVCLKIEREEANIRNTIADNALNAFTNWDKIFENNSTEEDLEKKIAIYLDSLVG